MFRLHEGCLDLTLDIESLPTATSDTVAVLLKYVADLSNIREGEKIHSLD